MATSPKTGKEGREFRGHSWSLLVVGPSVTAWGIKCSNHMPHTRVTTPRCPFHMALVNTLLDDTYHCKDVVCIQTNNVTSFAKHDIHLTWSGTSALARNLKEAINKSLGISSVSSSSTYIRCYPPSNQWQHNRYGQAYVHSNDHSRPMVIETTILWG